MISQGAAHMLKERLFNCSDPYQITVCNKCGMTINSEFECTTCKTDQVTDVNIPFAAKLLKQSLTSMCIKASIEPKM